MLRAETTAVCSILIITVTLERCCLSPKHGAIENVSFIAPDVE
jgi:hypothetical protein